MSVLQMCKGEETGGTEDPNHYELLKGVKGTSQANISSAGFEGCKRHSLDSMTGVSGPPVLS